MSAPTASEVAATSAIGLVALPHPHISPSQVKGFRRCAHQWYVKNVLRWKERANSALVLGSQVHHALEVGDREQLEGNGRPAAAKLAAYCADGMDAAVAKAVDKAEQPMDWKKGDSLPVLKDAAAAMVKAHEQELGPRIRPVLVEEWFEIPDGAGQGTALKGRMDLVAEAGLAAGAPEGDTVIDRKTSAKSPGKMAALDSEQRLAYTMAAQAKGRDPRAYEQHHLVRNKSGIKVVIVPSPAPDTDELAEYIENNAATVLQMRLGHYPKTNDMQVCSWCSFLNQCRPRIAAAVKALGEAEE